jgi:hypothetical protein
MLTMAYPELKLVSINGAKYLSDLVNIFHTPQLSKFCNLTFSANVDLGVDTQCMFTHALVSGLRSSFLPQYCPNSRLFYSYCPCY